MPRRTSLLFVNQHYYPDVASTGQHLTDLAEHLAREGYAVEVLASRGKYVAGRMDVPAREVRNGVHIRRVRTTTFGRGSHLGRLVDYLSFYVHVLIALLFGARRDGVVFLTTPPLLCVLGSIARTLRGQPYGIWSMDLHPDAEIASGMLHAGSLLARLLEWANATGYRRASFVVDLGPYMKERLVAKGVARERTHTVNVWSAREEIVPLPRDGNPLRQALGLDDRFVVMYSGNAGLVHDFRDICEAMRLLDDDPRIHFLFVGDGPRRPEIERYAQEHALRNFVYRGYFEREQLRHSLPLADAHLISLRAPFVGISVPGKLYGIMAAARPALFVGPERCESAETITRAGCGVVVDPDSPPGMYAGTPAERIAALLRCWADQPVVTETLGDRGRAAFLAAYEREGNCRTFTAAIASVWPGRADVAEPSAKAPPTMTGVEAAYDS